MISATPKIIVRYSRSACACHSSSHGGACGSAFSSFVTIQGPTGPKVSQPLPLSQVPPRSIWYSRSLTSLTTQ